MTQVSFKVSYESSDTSSTDIRRFRLASASIDELRNHISSVFLVEEFDLKYADEDGDMINIVHSSDLAEAVRQASSCVRLFVYPSNPTAGEGPEAEFDRTQWLRDHIDFAPYVSSTDNTVERERLIDMLVACRVRLSQLLAGNLITEGDLKTLPSQEWADHVVFKGRKLRERPCVGRFGQKCRGRWRGRHHRHALEHGPPGHGPPGHGPPGHGPPGHGPPGHGPPGHGPPGHGPPGHGPPGHGPPGHGPPGHGPPGHGPASCHWRDRGGRGGGRGRGWRGWDSPRGPPDAAAGGWAPWLQSQRHHLDTISGSLRQFGDEVSRGLETTVAATYAAVRGQGAGAGTKAGGGKRGGGGKQSVRFVKHVDCDDEMRTEDAGTVYKKIWRVRNDSQQPWPIDSALICVGGDKEQVDVLAVDDVRHPVSAGAESDLSATLRAPAQAGTYNLFWRLVDRTTGKRFGGRLWSQLTVRPTGSSDEEAPATLVPASMEASTAASTAASAAPQAVAVEESGAPITVSAAQTEMARARATLKGEFGAEFGYLIDMGLVGVHGPLVCAQKLVQYRGNVERVLADLGLSDS